MKQGSRYNQIRLTYIKGRPYRLAWITGGVMETKVMERIPPEKAVEILKKRGLEVNLEQAGLILDFLYKMADIAIAQCFKLPP